jgi:hypothetical protein
LVRSADKLLNPTCWALPFASSDVMPCYWPLRSGSAPPAMLQVLGVRASPAGVLAGAYESAPSGATLATTSTLKDADARMTSDVTALSEDLAALYAGLFKPVVRHLTLPTRAHMLALRPLGLLSPPFLLRSLIPNTSQEHRVSLRVR